MNSNAQTSDRPVFPHAEYKAALEAECENRDYAFLGLDHEICGMPIVQMTFRQMLVRINIDCPFLARRVPLAEDIASFLWHLSPTWEAPKCVDPSPARQAFIKAVAQIPYDEAIAAIDKYLDATLMDAPPVTEGKRRVPTTSIAATIIDIFGANYGWTRDQVLDAPVAQLYQLLREIEQRRCRDVIHFNRFSDAVRKKFGRELEEFSKARKLAVPADSADGASGLSPSASEPVVIALPPGLDPSTPAGRAKLKQIHKRLHPARRTTKRIRKAAKKSKRKGDR